MHKEIIANKIIPIIKKPFRPIIKANAIKTPKNAFLEKVKTKEREINIKNIVNNHLFLELDFAIKKNVKQRPYYRQVQA